MKMVRGAKWCGAVPVGIAFLFNVNSSAMPAAPEVSVADSLRAEAGSGAGQGSAFGPEAEVCCEQRAGQGTVARYEAGSRAEAGDVAEGGSESELVAGQGTVVMFWNVENFFDSVDDPLTADDDYTAFGKMRWGRKRFDRKRNAIAKTIISLRDVYGAFPAVVGLCEVENFRVLWRLVELTPLSKLGYKIIHRDSRDRRGIDVALLYREEFFEPLQTEFIEVSMPDTTVHTRLILSCVGVLRRGAGPAASAASGTANTQCLQCQSALEGTGAGTVAANTECLQGAGAGGPGDTVQIMVVHFPSKFGGAEASRPGREAACRALCAAARPEYPVLATGDFNAPIAELEELLPEFEHLAALNKNGTIKYRGEWEAIDNFIFRPVGALLPSGGESSERRPGRGPEWRSEIYAPLYLLEEDRTYLGYKPFRTFIGPRYNGGVSDHLPIVAHKAQVCTPLTAPQGPAGHIVAHKAQVCTAGF